LRFPDRSGDTGKQIHLKKKEKRMEDKKIFGWMIIIGAAILVSGAIIFSLI